MYSKLSLTTSYTKFLRFKEINWFSYRSSPQQVFLGKSVLKICTEFTGEYPCWSGISIKLLCILIQMQGKLQACRKNSFLSILRNLLKSIFFSLKLMRRLIWKNQGRLLPKNVLQPPTWKTYWRSCIFQTFPQFSLV